ncbi:MAG: hypothetical protein WCH01_20930 [Methylococcaceae bacterium]
MSQQQDKNDSDLQLSTAEIGSSVSFSDALIKLNDDFVEFSEMNAFVNHALVTSIADSGWLTPEIVSGAKRCSGWILQKGNEIRSDVRRLHERYHVETGASDSN